MFTSTSCTTTRPVRSGTVRPTAAIDTADGTKSAFHGPFHEVAELDCRTRCGDVRRGVSRCERLEHFQSASTGFGWGGLGHGNDPSTPPPSVPSGHNAQLIAPSMHPLTGLALTPLI